MGRIFFRRANLIDGRNAPKKNATVVVEDERITAVATNGDAPKPSANDVVYDLAGRSLMPGMVQCHYHVAYDNIDSARRYRHEASADDAHVDRREERRVAVALRLHRRGRRGHAAQYRRHAQARDRRRA